jgi:hypothetical protein
MAAVYSCPLQCQALKPQGLRTRFSQWHAESDLEVVCTAQCYPSGPHQAPEQSAQEPEARRTCGLWYPSWSTGQQVGQPGTPWTSHPSGSVSRVIMGTTQAWETRSTTNSQRPIATSVNRVTLPLLLSYPGYYCSGTDEYCTLIFMMMMMMNIFMNNVYHTTTSLNLGHIFLFNLFYFILFLFLFSFIRYPCIVYYWHTHIDSTLTQEHNCMYA